MLEEISDQCCRHLVIRWTSHRSDDDFLRDLDMSPEQVSEMKELLHRCGTSDSLEALLDASFRRQRRLSRPGSFRSRFSDGSFPVGYFSLESEAAEAEVRHWFSGRFAGCPNRRRTAWCSRFTCDFRGRVKDLRSMQHTWPDLMHGKDYTFCHRLGVEAVSEDLDGLLVPSVRNSGGTNVPVFVRRALSHPREHSWVGIRCEGSRHPGEC